MRMSVAKIGNRSAELVLDLLSIANNMSVRMFLHNIFEDDELEYFDDPKRALMNHLLQYMTKYIEMHIPKKEGVLELKIRYDKNTPYFIPSVPFIEDVYVPLYLHLHLLSENYYSYRVVTNQNILDGQLSNDISNNSQNKNKGDISKKGSLTKLLHLLIESSIDNKFYYCFWGDFLYKFEIKSQIIPKKNEETGKMYNDKVPKLDFKEYQLKDINGETFVINNNIGVNESLGTLLVRNNYCYDVTSKDIVNDASGYISFTNITKIHKKIIKILKYKKCKGATVSDKNIEKLRKKCKNLLNELKQLQNKIDPNAYNDYFSIFLTYDFEGEIFTIGNSETFDNMRDFRHDRKKKLNTHIKNLEQAIIEEDDEYIYGEILKQINNIKLLIEKIFN